MVKFMHPPPPPPPPPSRVSGLTAATDSSLGDWHCGRIKLCCNFILVRAIMTVSSLLSPTSYSELIVDKSLRVTVLAAAGPGGPLAQQPPCHCHCRAPGSLTLALAGWHLAVTEIGLGLRGGKSRSACRPRPGRRAIMITGMIFKFAAARRRPHTRTRLATDTVTV